MSRGALPQSSGYAVRIFAAYGRHFLRRNFHSIRVLKGGQPPGGMSQPLVIYLNHASWWDPLVCLYLARKWFPQRTSFAPINSASLEKYRFFQWIGLYGIERGTTCGAIKFLRTTSSILGSKGNLLWLTPQGRFIDVRERPLQFERGIGVLAARMSNVAFLPLALEYSFWTEPQPEILVSFGTPIVSGGVRRPPQEWTELLAACHAGVQDDLAERSCRRDPRDWQLLERGARGVNVLYDTWRAVCSRLGRRAFAREHQPEEWA